MCLAIPGQIVSISELPSNLENSCLYRSGKVSFGGILKEVNLAYVPEAEVGNYVIVHVGFALNIVDEEEARQTLSDLEELSAMSS